MSQVKERHRHVIALKLGNIESKTEKLKGEIEKSVASLFHIEFKPD